MIRVNSYRCTYDTVILTHAVNNFICLHNYILADDKKLSRLLFIPASKK